MALERELKTYNAKLPELREQEGRFVLIHEDSVVDTFESYVDALKRGYHEFGVKPFLVKRINAHEVAQMVTRLFTSNSAIC
ncbi:MAG TPA: hypothetical protein DGD08_08430 [Gemmatimonas aurantiaca]|uniref:DUF5678 domain-containing protein n=2 Tax=Gemmatimonas aurantiaca TaxID=173480 RepID=C1A466_GEMAT|nr:hypothetical protein [Gemmatimonas aurantiaca]BAH38891.1 hypothetical protein GAU_1849 [Gemmatimonas aurantiaca T-27]HCT57224.1 hypothetical protein [Gemmatimonas aurantiaca]